MIRGVRPSYEEPNLTGDLGRSARHPRSSDAHIVAIFGLLISCWLFVRYMPWSQGSLECLPDGRLAGETALTFQIL